MKSIAFMPRKPGTSRRHFRDYYENRHAPLAAPLFPFTRYRRNHIADDAAEPGFDAVSEFWFEDAEAIGALMAGGVGDTMRADERNFLDQPRIVAALADVALEAGDDADVLLLIDDRGGSHEALVSACREAGAGLDFLSAMGEAAPPHDALVYASGAEPATPEGWNVALRLPVERAETDMDGARS